MKICNFGSLNCDHVYLVDHIVQPGETLTACSYTIHPGGKGFNQSIALARAGAIVSHGGCIGNDGLWLVERLRSEGVDTEAIDIVSQSTGQAIIQVSVSGENAIFLNPGANHCITGVQIQKTLSVLKPGDCILVQNEISRVQDIIRQSLAMGLIVAFNPAPMTISCAEWDLNGIKYLFINEIEGAMLTGKQDARDIMDDLYKRYPSTICVLTLGSRGVLLSKSDGQILDISAFSVRALDTTGAGDTFIGFFLVSALQGENVSDSARRACAAAALCVTKQGAGDSIPGNHEVEQFLKLLENIL